MLSLAPSDIWILAGYLLAAWMGTPVGPRWTGPLTIVRQYLLVGHFSRCRQKVHFTWTVQVPIYVYRLMFAFSARRQPLGAFNLGKLEVLTQSAQLLGIEIQY